MKLLKTDNSFDVSGPGTNRYTPMESANYHNNYQKFHLKLTYGEIWFWKLLQKKVVHLLILL
jgi:hypothetical protein